MRADWRRRGAREDAPQQGEGISLVRLGLADRRPQLEQNRSCAVAGNAMVASKPLRATRLKLGVLDLVENDGPAERLTDGCRVGRCRNGGIVRLPLVLQLAAIAAGDISSREGRDQRRGIRGLNPRAGVALAPPRASPEVNRA